MRNDRTRQVGQGLEPGEDPVPGAVPLPSTEQVVDPASGTVLDGYVPPGHTGRPGAGVGDLGEGCGEGIGGLADGVGLGEVQGGGRGVVLTPECVTCLTFSQVTPCGAVHVVQGGDAHAGTGAADDR
ncbi:hypothetical protein GCM10010273_41180 [Streptomyces lavendulocolor]